ncbi:hypothetical protein Agub_g1877 [Astrephomene gubernaculifera]|uniref:Survival protein SurE-like phosphatase/nucleotidase domain-containing protein n=1 Tax=Astrephomene gubernaculifera TaxID=47775 RepID=A0AAD3DI92_9CHLO|nr:hypothetical protein Agub_g1877 [Astrephomene gubernaculifera]
MHRFAMKGQSIAAIIQRHGRQCLSLSRSRSLAIKAQATQPCLVLSNDDGVESVALQSLASRLRQDTGHRVVVVAPARNKSAASMGLTLRQDMELRVRSDLGPDTYALTGTPTDCMMVALDATRGLLRALELHPLLALSGPNYGPNMGTDVLLSGTVGAARTAGLYGVPALASSSTSMDKDSALDNAVEATAKLTTLALAALGGQPARNWPRTHIPGGIGAGGRRHSLSTCEYESAPQQWAMDVEEVLVEAFRDGDVFLNLNVPADWQPGRGNVQTTGLGLMFYRDSYVVRVPNKPPAALAAARARASAATASAVATATTAAAAVTREERQFLSVTAAAGGSGNGHSLGCSSNGGGASCSGSISRGDGCCAEPDQESSAVVEDIAEALAAGQPILYNNAYDTRRILPVDRSDVMALQRGDLSISTLQTWPEGHTLCLSDRVMSRALLSGHDGMPAWLHGRG